MARMVRRLRASTESKAPAASPVTVRRVEPRPPAPRRRRAIPAETSPPAVTASPAPRPAKKAATRATAVPASISLGEVDILAVADALFYAGGDRRRLKAVDRRTVLVLNNPA